VSQFQQKNPTGPLLWPLAPALVGLLGPDLAAYRKEVKYADLPSSYTFQPMTLETLGPLSSSTMVFCGKTWSSAISIPMDNRSRLPFFFQRLSVAVQMFNAVLIEETID